MPHAKTAAGGEEKVSLPCECNLPDIVSKPEERQQSGTHLDFVLPIEFVIVQRVLRHRRAALVHILHERDVLLGGDESHFVQVRVSANAITASEGCNH